MENSIIEYKVVKPCKVDGKDKEPDQKVRLNPKSALAHALLRFGQIVEVPGQPEPVKPEEKPKEEPAKPLEDDGTVRGELLKKSAIELREIGAQLGLAFKADDTKPEVVKAIMKATGYKVD